MRVGIFPTSGNFLPQGTAFYHSFNSAEAYPDARPTGCKEYEERKAGRVRLIAFKVTPKIPIPAKVLNVDRASALQRRLPVWMAGPCLSSRSWPQSRTVISAVDPIVQTIPQQVFCKGFPLRPTEPTCVIDGTTHVGLTVSCISQTHGEEPGRSAYQ